MSGRHVVLLAIFLWVAAVFVGLPVAAAGKHRVVVEVNVAAPAEWEGILNNVDNLQKAFGASETEIEVVAHGKGLGLLRKTNAAQAERIERMSATGVRFAACENTMRRLRLSKSDLFGFAVTVDSGVAETVRKQEAGWSYLKGGG